jgi:hypothetical protein
MKIDPVYLLGPVGPRPTFTTRRAFLLASGTFLTGTAIGTACGYSAGVASAGAAASAPPPIADPARDAELPKSGDAELNQLRHLAVKAPLDDLFAKAMLFLSARVRAYPKDEILWQGVERMSRELVANEGRVVDQMVILVITGQIEGTARPPEPSLRDLVPVLRERREQARRRK